MNTKLWTKGSVFATFMVCCVVLALLSSSLATDYWVTASGKSANDTDAADVNLGLFKGLVVKYGLTDVGYDIYLVCLTNDTTSACMYSCGRTAEDRTADLADLIYTNGSDWVQASKCDSEVSSVRAGRSSVAAAGVGMPTLLIWGVMPPMTQLAADSVTSVSQTEPQFMSYGLWLSTIVMLGGAIVFTLVAAMFAILNTATTPVETIFGVLGLYVWNAIAMVFELLSLSLWGAQFHQHLQHSVLWREEKVQQWTSDGLASLGYSYWLVFVAMFLHAINMGILWFGMHQMQPKTVQVPVEREPNAANMIY